MDFCLGARRGDAAPRVQARAAVLAAEHVLGVEEHELDLAFEAQSFDL